MGRVALAERLRIAFVTPEYVTERYFDGGLANYTHRVAKALADLGHDIHVVTLSEIDQVEFMHEGVTVHRITHSKMWYRLNQLARPRLATAMRWLDVSAQVYRKLKQLDAQQPLQLVQLPNYSCCGLVSTIFLRRVPQVLRASSYRPGYNRVAGVARGLNARTVELLEELQFHLSRHIYAPSVTLQHTLLKEAHLARVRVIRTPCYVETQEWDYTVYERYLKDKAYLLFFGRFQALKGFHLLAQALPRLLARFPDSHAALIGRDTGEATVGVSSMADYARSLCGDAAAARLVVIENLPHPQLYPIVAGARLVVLPSLIDNSPNACLEAMALGKPVVGTNGASFEELIDDGTTGFLVPPNDVAALAETMIHAWGLPQLPEIGRAARRKALEFAPEKTVPALVSYYREILQHAPASSVSRLGQLTKGRPG